MTLAKRAEVLRMDLRKRGILPKCRLCRMPLTAPLSILRGVGPVCWKRDRQQLPLDLGSPATDRPSESGSRGT